MRVCAKMFVLCVAALGGNAGCAFMTVTVAPPDEETRKAAVASRPREVTLQSPFSDARRDRSRCGIQKNGLNLETADVECTVPPVQWLADALTQGLTAAGYQVVSTGFPDAPAASPSSVVVRGEVLQFFIEPKVGVFTFSPEADISVRLVMTSPSGLRAARRFYFKSEEVSLFGTESNFQAAADSATQQAVRGMVTAIVELLDRYPDLGTPTTVRRVALRTDREEGR